MNAKPSSLIFVATVLVACGGAQPGATVATAHASAVDTPDAGGADETQPDATLILPTTPYVIELKNEGATDLSLSVDKGWAFTIFAAPPKAAQLPPWMFAKHCTASCAATTAEMCPICTVQVENVVKRKKAEIEAAQYVTVLPGESHLVPWSGKFYTYEKAPAAARGENKTCECFREVDAVPGDYVIQSYGLRPPKKVGEARTTSRGQAAVTLPTTGAAGSPTRITIIVK